MGLEKSLIKSINDVMPRSQLQLNNLFESDSEIVEFGGMKMLFTIDEFSEEDMLREHDPFILGWNLTVGAISDILATGGRPVFYAHSMTIDKNWDEDYVKLFSEGIASALKEANTSFIGGDFGRSGTWRYTATVIGALEGEPLLRSKAREGDSIFISGKVGTGNFEAFIKMVSDRKLAGKLSRPIKNRFCLRLKEAELIRRYAGACIDTSDGVFNAINTICEMSKTGYEVRDLPYIKTGALAAKAFSMPKTLLFLGECGEYELLFTVGVQNEEAFLKEASEKGLEFYKIGSVTEAQKRVLIEDRKQIDLSSVHIRARDFDDMRAYIKALMVSLKDNQI